MIRMNVLKGVESLCGSEGLVRGESPSLKTLARVNFPDLRPSLVV